MTAESPYEAKIIFADCSEGLSVSSLGSNLYRLEETSFCGDARYHDIIEAEMRDDGSLRFVRVVTPSELKTSSYVLSKELSRSPLLTAFLDKVVSVGGNWETLLGGFLILHLPAEKETSMLLEFNTLASDLPENTSPA